MENRESYLEKIKSFIDVCDKEIEKLNSAAQSAELHDRELFRDEKVSDKLTVLKTEFQALKKADQSAWSELKKAVEDAREDVLFSIQRAASRLHKKVEIE
jgi:hypothetical protein